MWFGCVLLIIVEAGRLSLVAAVVKERALHLDVMKIDLPLIGAVQSLADAAREVAIGGGDEDDVSLLPFAHEAVLPALPRHRMLRWLLHAGVLSSVCGPIDEDISLT
jgi:hypothetical protein